jgi:hypothetical protein
MEKLCVESLVNSILIICKENGFTNCEMKSLPRKLEIEIDRHINEQIFSLRDSNKLKEILTKHGYLDCLSTQKSISSRQEAE